MSDSLPRTLEEWRAEALSWFEQAQALSVTEMGWQNRAAQKDATILRAAHALADQTDATLRQEARAERLTAQLAEAEWNARNEREDAALALKEAESQRDAATDALRTLHEAAIAGRLGAHSLTCGPGDCYIEDVLANLPQAAHERDERLAAKERKRLRELVEAIPPSHDAAYWGLAGHPTIIGADDQSAAYMRQEILALLASPVAPEEKK